MGNSISNKKSIESKENTQSSSRTLSSFGDPNATFRNKIHNMALEGNIPLTKKDHYYKIYTWEKGAFDHESVVIRPIKTGKSNDAQEYGSFTIELVVDVSSKTIHLTTRYIEPSKSAKYIKEQKWVDELNTPFLFFHQQVRSIILEIEGKIKKKPIIIKTHSENFIELAIALIKHHGKYSSYCNNCQTFVYGFLQLAKNHFVYQKSINLQAAHNSDGEIAAVIIGFFFGWGPIGVNIVSVVNKSLVKSNENAYDNLNESCNQLLPTQQKKVSILMKEFKLTKSQSIDLLWQSLWDLEEAKLMLKDGKKDINELIKKDKLITHNGCNIYYTNLSNKKISL